MGVILEAECSCGFTCEEMGIGATGAHEGRYCGIPALCSLCGAFEVHNRLATEPKCSRCRSAVVFYDEASLQSPSTAPSAPLLFTAEGTRGLPDTTYRCPLCGKLEMVFRVVGDWE